jgi:hypothetical protein
MGGSSAEVDRRAVEAWFRRRGLPLVIRRRLLGSGLLQRSTPALVFLLFIDPLVSAIGKLITVERIERIGDNSALVIALLALTVAALTIPVLAGWLDGGRAHGGGPAAL